MSSIDLTKPTALCRTATIFHLEQQKTPPCDSSKAYLLWGCWETGRQEPEPDLEPEPEPEPEAQQPAALDRAAHPEDAAQPELAALLGTVLPEVVAPQGAESDGEEAQPGAGVLGDGVDAPASNDGTQAETAAAVVAQKERLATLEARQTASPTTDSTAPAPAPKQVAEAPTVPRKPAVSVFARRTSRFSVTVLEGHSDGITGIALLGERGATVVTASFDCTVKWWDSRTGAELKSLVSEQRNSTFSIEPVQNSVQCRSTKIHWTVWFARLNSLVAYGCRGNTRKRLKACRITMAAGRLPLLREMATSCSG